MKAGNLDVGPGLDIRASLRFNVPWLSKMILAASENGLRLQGAYREGFILGTQAGAE